MFRVRTMIEFEINSIRISLTSIIEYVVIIRKISSTNFLFSNHHKFRATQILMLNSSNFFQNCAIHFFPGKTKLFIFYIIL